MTAAPELPMGSIDGTLRAGQSSRVADARSVFELRASTSVEGTLELTRVVPYIDGVSLVELVAEYEKTRAFEPSGSYGGIVPTHRFGLDHLSAYYRDSDSTAPGGSIVEVLSCGCGEFGCWPLLARITVDDDDVVWADFSQPHRSSWDYSAFGPFVFGRDEYETALDASDGPTTPNP